MLFFIFLLRVSHEKEVEYVFLTGPLGTIPAICLGVAFVFWVFQPKPEKAQTNRRAMCNLHAFCC